MIKNNKFYINNLSSVVLIGESEVIEKLVAINNSIKLKTLLIAKPEQKKFLNKKIKYKIFNKIDNKFEKLIQNTFDPNCTIFISIGSRYIFKKHVIEKLFSNNLVNFHGTRLPLDAGGGGFSWKIMREDRIDNQLVHLVDSGIDTGPIIDNDMSLFPRNCQIPKEFETFRLKKFLIFYENFIKKIFKGKKFELKPQISYLGRYNPRLNTDLDGLINWDMDSYDLINFINAFDSPYKGASTYINNRKLGKLYLKKVQLHGGDSSNHPFMSGIVSRHDGKWIVVSTKTKHMLLVEEILDINGKNQINNIRVGDRFYTPVSELNNLKTKRTRY